MKHLTRAFHRIKKVSECMYLYNRSRLRLGVRVAVEDCVLCPFFVVDDEGDGDFGVVGPLRVVRVLAVADEVC